ncbi:AMP-binding protein [Sedimentitalea nanhaiensis]|uniref:Crotonobetaine/carnitine-CoA ligase n=1 Tax=Sedimentitalea nanhaiensis TaxID=999627 RepID=A0A1I7DFW3_9RHOB|nr:AMP-binding protein [Sedimentitalea nanhaiensis]SFU10496.1 crotonobetaine/carnitine-CoA ligase [Sedimentitalea nanhaiensis]
MQSLKHENRQTVASLFEKTAEMAPDLVFVAWRETPDAPFQEQTYGAFLQGVKALRERYAAAGYGVGMRVALLIGNRPEFYTQYLALNGLGVSIVPLNPQATASEMRYAIDHSGVAIVLFHPHLSAPLEAALSAREQPLPRVNITALPDRLPVFKAPASRQAGTRDDEAAILYTSGTTNKPKGCVLTNRYVLEAGHAYANWGGMLSLQYGHERLLNPLPLFHMNNLVVTTTAMIEVAGCNVMIERFSPTRWWQDCGQSRATIIHYLGVMPAMLLSQPVNSAEIIPSIRIGVGAGVDPKHHAAFEARFDFPLIELWGMTETGCGFIASEEPRHVGTRAFGRPGALLHARVVDDNLRDVATGQVGELLVQSIGDDPRKTFFSRYLNDPDATAEAWHGDWFRTGDVVRQDQTGMLYFVDRKKNIIRRSGENIAAMEVEAALQSHPDVSQVAVIAVRDELRDEEVFACAVVRDGVAHDSNTARRLFDWVIEQLAYFKAPGYICFRPELPMTGTQKLQKSLIFARGESPVAAKDTFDMRPLKRRSRTGSAPQKGTAQ